ncbi:MAG: membrane protein insertase YidC [Clostridiales bacterium]|nr:membrane protein insertase YidC [Clostridiales bacterium]
MEIFNVLAGEIGFSLFGEPLEVSLNWIGRLVRGIISSGVGVGIGIILFSLILKVIVLPFDIFQRISLRKQNIKMRENKDKMEKLQKQYANDKKMYNQKLMEIQRQSGMSLLSSCLPMILSMVIFFMAIGAFNAYAKYSTVQNYNTLVENYNEAVNVYVVDIDDESEYSWENNTITVKEADKIIFVKLPIGDETKIAAINAAYNEATTPTDKAKVLQAEVKAYGNLHANLVIDVAKAEANAEVKAYLGDLTAADKGYEEKIKDFFYGKGAEGAKVAYENEVKGATKFLWIKNVWATDASYKHPVLDHEDFLKEIASSSCGSSCSSNGRFILETANGKQEISIDGTGALKVGNTAVTNVYEKDAYNKVTASLGEQKGQANGYYILIVLSIGTILLQQFIAMRSQKEQQKYSSVDGQAASTQKMTMIVMTIVFGVFSFMYSSAFSIYMITSNIFSLASTLIINKCVDVSEHKREQKALQEKFNRRLPRTSNADKKGNGKNKKK